MILVLLIAFSISFLNCDLGIKKTLFDKLFISLNFFIVCNCDMALTPALITFFGLPINLFVKDIKVTFFNSSRYLILSLNTGPIIILTPFL